MNEEGGWKQLPLLGLMVNWVIDLRTRDQGTEDSGTPRGPERNTITWIMDSLTYVYQHCITGGYIAIYYTFLTLYFCLRMLKCILIVSFK